MPTLFDQSDRDALLARLGHLEAGTPRRWGTMNGPQMVAHCAAALRMALGDLEVPPRTTIAANPVIRFLMIHVLPMPRGLPTAKQLKHEPEGIDFERQRAELRELVERFGRCVPTGAWAVHPAFGAISGKDWGVQQYGHLDHHFKQFGL